MKELHIRVESHIGIMTDEFGWLWTGFTAMELEWRLMELPNPEKLIIHMNSPGGCVNEGLSIFNRLMDLRKSGTIIEVINEGICYSIATFIAMAANPGHLIGREASLWCPHKPYFPSTGGNADDLRKAADELDSNEAILANAYVQRTGKALEEVQGILKLDKIINSTEAAASGWIDSVIPSLANAPAPTAQALAAKPMAFYRPNPQQQNQIENKMPNEKKPSKWKQLANFIANLGSDEDEGGAAASTEDEQVVATSETLEDGTTIYFEGELNKDTAVYSDEAMTASLADGDYIMTDGRVLVVVGGIVSDIKEAEAANSKELETANAEIDRLKKELETATQASAAKDSTIKNLQAQNRKAATPKPTQNFAGDNNATGSHPLDNAANQIKTSKK